jgi:hypothetical protein
LLWVRNIDRENHEEMVKRWRSTLLNSIQNTLPMELIDIVPTKNCEDKSSTPSPTEDAEVMVRLLDGKFNTQAYQESIVKNFTPKVMDKYKIIHFV